MFDRPISLNRNHIRVEYNLWKYHKTFEERHFAAKHYVILFLSSLQSTITIKIWSKKMIHFPYVIRLHSIYVYIIIASLWPTDHRCVSLLMWYIAFALFRNKHQIPTTCCASSSIDSRLVAIKFEIDIKHSKTLL